MSMKDYETAVSLMEKYPDLHYFVGRRPEELVRLAESALNLSFPPTYRRFISDYGAGCFGAFEICGLTGQNFDKGTVPNGIWYTLTERKKVNLPEQMIVIYEDGMGGLFCIDTSLSDAQGENPIVALDPGSDRPLEPIAEDFGAFFLDMINDEIAYQLNSRAEKE